jgi:transmembrane sensor
MISETSNDNKSVQEQANLWITRLDKGLSSVEKQQLVAWINQDKAHYSSLHRMSSLWGDISTQHELNGLFGAKQEKKPASDYLMKGCLAASIFSVAILSVNLASDISHLWQGPKASISQQLTYQKFSTQFGQQKEITLTDGSTIKLNTNTIIEVAYSSLQRKITLIRGEAKFDVAKDSNRPFTVISGENAFTALGTIYNVQRDNSRNMELLVKEGRVLVSKANTSRTVLLDTIKSSQSRTLTASEKVHDIVTAGEKLAIIDESQSTKQTLSIAAMEKELAWQQGMLIFDGESLSQVLSEVQRYNSVKFMPIDKNIADLKISGYFKSNDINGLLKSLSYNFAINYQKINNNTFVLSRT